MRTEREGEILQAEWWEGQVRRCLRTIAELTGEDLGRWIRHPEDREVFLRPIGLDGDRDRR